MTYKEIVSKVSQELGIPENVVNAAYRSQFQFIRSTISELQLKDDISEEEFNKLRVGFNLPALGKMYTTYEDVLGVKKRYEYIKNLRNENSNGNKAKV